METISKYCLDQIRSSVNGPDKISFISLDQLAKDVNEGWIIIWQHHKVFTGKIENGTIQILMPKPGPVVGEEHIVCIRAFNELVEYYFWRNGFNKLIGRYRKDAEGEGIDVIDTSMILRSAVAIPWAEIENEKTDNNQKIAVKTRNYIDFNEIGQASYVDSRFIGFEVLNQK